MYITVIVEIVHRPFVCTILHLYHTWTR